MRRSRSFSFVRTGWMLIAVAILCPGSRAEAPDPRLPVGFEPNLGQADAATRFLARGAGYRLLLDATGARIVASGASPAREVRVGFVGANDGVVLEPRGLLPTRVHYLVGDHSSDWLTDVPTHDGVVYRGLYPGVDLDVHGDRRRLDLELTVAADADPDGVVLAFDGVEVFGPGADGALALRAGGVEIRMAAPVASSLSDVEMPDLAAALVIQGGGRVAFEVAGREGAAPLSIHTSLLFSPVGGSDPWDRLDGSLRVAADRSGATFVSGRLPATSTENRLRVDADAPAAPGATPEARPRLPRLRAWLESLDGLLDFEAADKLDRVAELRAAARERAIPATPAAGLTLADLGEAFVAGLDRQDRVVFVTYFGGSGDDVPHDLTITPAGDIVVAGSTSSNDFPGIEAARNGAVDAFLLRLAGDGASLRAATAIGGDGEDAARGVAIDAEGAAWLTGDTRDADGGEPDVLVARVDPDGTTTYRTRLGGAGEDVGHAIAVDERGAVYLTGETLSIDFPLLEPMQAELAGGRDAFVVKLAADGSGPVYATYLGGSADDRGLGIAVDPQGQAHVVGTTHSADLPLISPAQPSFGGPGASDHGDAFVVKLDARGGAPLYSTFVGGSGDDRGCDIALDDEGRAWITGITDSPDFPVTAADKAGRRGMTDAFVSGVDLAGNEFGSSVYLGGAADDAGTGLVVLPDGTAVVVGATHSTDLPGRTLESSASGGEAFVARVAPAAAPRTIGCPGTINFDNGAGTLQWTDQANWDTNVLPAAGDDVCIDGFAVTLSSGVHTIATLQVAAGSSLTSSGGSLTIVTEAVFDGDLTQNGGTLTGSANITTNGVYAWNGGTLSGTGTSFADTGITMDGTAQKTLGRVLVNAAGQTASWLDGDINISVSGARFDNAGAFRAEHADNHTILGFTDRLFNNLGTGTFVKAAPMSGVVGITVVGAPFNNDGAVTVEAGELRLQSGGDSTGSLTVDPGATLRFNGGTHNLSAASSVVSDGTVVFDAGTVNVSGTYTANNDTDLAGGTVAFASGSTVSMQALNLSSGTLTGDQDVPVSGLLTWTGGAMTGTATTFANGGITMDSTAQKTLSRVLVNAAGQTASWLDGDINISVSGARFDNAGAFRAEHADNHNIFGFTDRIFNNLGTGTFVKAAPMSGVVGITVVGAPFNDDGAVTVEAGELRLQSGGDSTGSLTVDPGATLRFNGGTHNLSAASSIVSNGTVIFDAGTVNVSGTYTANNDTDLVGGTVAFASGSTVSMQALNLSSGALTGDQDVPVSGLLTWTGGAMTGTATTFANGGITMDSTAQKVLSRVLVNAPGQTASWLDGDINISVSGARFDNAGAFRAEHADNRNIFGFTDRIFNNLGTGTFVKATPMAGLVGATVVGAPFNNDGAVTVEAGELRLQSGGDSTGSLTVDPGAALRFNGGTYNRSAASSIVSNGTVIFSSGTVNVAGTYTANGDTDISGGTVNYASGSTLSVQALNLSTGTLTGDQDVPVSGLLTWTGGSMTGTATTFANGGMVLDGTAQKVLSRVLVNAAGQMASWLDGDINISVSGARFDNEGTFRVEHADIGTIFGFTDRIFNNLGTGTFVKAAPVAGLVGATVVGAPFNNDGAVTVEAGELRLQSGGDSTGSLTGDPGTTIRFNGGTHNLSAASSVVSDGTIIFFSGTVNVAGTYTANGDTDISGGTANYTSGSIISMQALNLSSGTLNGDQDVPVSGLLTWTGGSMVGTATTFANGSVVIDGTTTKTLGRVLVNAAGQTASWLDGDINLTTSGASLDNAGTFRAEHADDRTIFGFTDRVFNNLGSGMFVKTAPAAGVVGVTILSAPWNNNGMATVEAGELRLQGGGDSTGSLTLNPGTTLRFFGNANLSATSSIVSNGTVIFDNGTVNLAGGYTANGDTDIAGGTAAFQSGSTPSLQALNLSAGLLDGGQDVPVAGLLTWTGGGMSGSGSTLANGGIVIDAPTFKTLGRVLVNAAGQTASWRDGDLSISTSGASFDNAGTFRAEHAGDRAINGFTDRVFNNLGTGTFVKAPPLAGVVGTTTMNAPLNNAGTTDIQAGTLRADTYTQTAGSTILDGGAMSAFGQPINIAGGTLTGNGMITAPAVQNTGGALGPGLGGAGTIALDGDYTQQTGGGYMVEIGGPTAGTEYDQFNLVPPAFGTNDVTLDGNLDVMLINAFVPNPGDSFTILTFDNRTGTFLENLAPLPCGRDWNVVYDDVAGEVRLEVVATPSADLIVTQSDSPDPVPVGETLTYTVTVANNGPSDATGTTLTDTIPTNSTFVSATPSQGTCSETAGVVTCDLGTLINGGMATVAIAVTPTLDGTITNSASATSDLCDPFPGDETGITEDTTVVPACPDDDNDDYADCTAIPSCLPVSPDQCGDCDDTDPAINPDTLWYEDSDSDGFGNPAVSQQQCPQPAGFVLDNTDCDDTVATCTTDCTTDVDADTIADCADTCIDVDGDGFGTAGPAGDTCAGTDCDDADPNNWASCGTCVDMDADSWFVGCDAYVTINGPDCDDTLANCTADCSDTNMNGTPDCAEICPDVDGDNFVVCDGICSLAPGDQCGECDDGNAATFPGAPEICDGLDNDCDTVVPANEADADADTFRVCDGDCDDGDPNTFPGAAEICDGLDNDCDTVVPANEADADADTFRICDNDCDDADPDTYPGAPELCDGLDNDCDTVVPANEADADADTFRICDNDCDDGNASSFPGATEICDGLDNDCDGSLPPDEADADGDSVSICEGDCDDTDPAVSPNAMETGAVACADGIDNDCDGLIDMNDFQGCGQAITVCFTLGDQPAGESRDRDVFFFDGAAGEDVTATVDPMSSATGRANLFLSGSGVFVQDRSDLPNQVTATLPAAGEFQIVVAQPSSRELAGGRAYQGDYCLTFEATLGAAQTLTPGPSVE